MDRDDPGKNQMAMERTLTILDQARAVVGEGEPLPCDAQGAPAA